MQTEFTRSVKDTKGRRKIRHKGRTTKNVTDTESFLYHRFPLIGGVGMRGGKDKIQMNEV